MPKLISLNAWGGKGREALLAFVEQEEKDTDVFCFQEIFQSDTCAWLPSGCHADLYRELEKALPGFVGYFSPEQDGFDIHGKVPAELGLSIGHATFVRKEVLVTTQGHFFIYRERNGIQNEDTKTMPKLADYVAVRFGGEHYIIVNVHGLWWPYDKLDTEERIAQSGKLRTFLDGRSEKKILCGDLNLRPETRSIYILDEVMRNLVKEYGVKTTRSAHYDFLASDPFADYVFVSHDVRVINFSLPDVAVSDHLPLVLQFQ